ncbi:hypothetical protein TCAL_16043 [Tigriopus californicus]|uniref:Uncharacterized protein n=1 Tax=Tigriopus californicus TaxID=6832 RepID=A0A553PNS7_TIGCA|nr:hypothetical protein TCAL_16043 [Tigriopus californicus]
MLLECQTPNGQSISQEQQIETYRNETFDNHIYILNHCLCKFQKANIYFITNFINIRFNNSRIIYDLRIHIANFKHLFDQHITSFNNFQFLFFCKFHFPWFFFVIKLRNDWLLCLYNICNRYLNINCINNNFSFCFIFKFNNGRFFVGLELHIANFKHLFDQHITSSTTAGSSLASSSISQLQAPL